MVLQHADAGERLGVAAAACPRLHDQDCHSSLFLTSHISTDSDACERLGIAAVAPPSLHAQIPQRLTNISCLRFDVSCMWRLELRRLRRVLHTRCTAHETLAVAPLASSWQGGKSVLKSVHPSRVLGGECTHQSPGQPLV